VIKRRSLSFALDCILIFLFVAVLIRPLYKAKYLELWHSIESTFIADARFLRDHWLHPNWQPNWYCGTRTDYIYPPALRYGSAVIMKVHPKVLPVKAYHLYVAFFYCFGIAAVYALVRGCSGSRGSAWLASIASALVTPSFLFAHTIRDDTPFQMPYRLNVLLRYGEGPHMSSLAWIPLALLFAYRALSGRRPASLALAAVACAGVVSNNFYGATSLAILFPLLAWSIYITHLGFRVWVRAAAIAVLAYGLTAFWLVPSYIRITLDNMKFVSSAGNMWSAWVGLGVIVAFVLLSDHFARGCRDRAYVVFLCGATAAFFVNVVGNHYLDFRIIGEPGRLFPEFDLLFILLAVEGLRRLWVAPWRWPLARRALASIIVIAALGTSWRYLQNSRSIFVTDPDIEDQVEYQMQDWMAKNKPGARAVAGGAVRFWYNVWHDLPQLGGGSEQGLLNPNIMPPQWEIFIGESFELSNLWMHLFGVDAILVNEKHSREHYHDYQYPEKFRGKLPVLHDNGAGDIIYAVPRRYPSLARVVERARFDALPRIPGNGQIPELQAWFDVVERGPEAPTETTWMGTDELHIKAPVGEGQAVWVQVSYDTNWRAYIGETQVPIRSDKLGLMLIDAPAGTQEIRLQFPTPRANYVGRTVSLISLLIVFALIWRSRRREAPL
jgi:hypothetical protein